MDVLKNCDKKSESQAERCTQDQNAAQTHGVAMVKWWEVQFLGADRYSRHLLRSAGVVFVLSLGP